MPLILRNIPRRQAHFKLHGIAVLICPGADDVHAQFEFRQRIERPFENTLHTGKGFYVAQVAFGCYEKTGAGHFPHEERPERFDDELLGWLRDPEPER